MDQYSYYIRSLKQETPKVNFDSLYWKIKESCGEKKNASISRPLVGLVIVTLLFLLSLPLLMNRGGSLSEEGRTIAYVFQNDEISDHAAADFILND